MRSSDRIAVAAQRQPPAGAAAAKRKSMRTPPAASKKASRGATDELCSEKSPDDAPAADSGPPDPAAVAIAIAATANPALVRPGIARQGSPNGETGPWSQVGCPRLGRLDATGAIP